MEGFDIGGLKANAENLIFIGSKISNSFTLDAIKHHHAALRATTLSGGTQEWFSDLEITNLTIDAYSITYTSWPLTYFSADVTAVVRNNGSLPAQSFYLNNAVASGICVPEIRNIPFNEIINPGEEVNVLYPDVRILALGSPNDSILLNACLFVTQPYQDIDINRDNDSWCTSMLVLSSSEVDLNKRVGIFPNPAQNQIGLDTDLQLNSYKLYDAFAKLVDQGSLRDLRSIDTNQLPDGFYFLKLETDKGELTKKIVIAR
jgi:hypothetical protein